MLSVKNRSVLSTFAAASLLIGGVHASAVTLISDGFDDGVLAGGADALGGTWYSRNNAASTATTPGIVGGEVSFVTSATNSSILSAFSAVTLAAAGDYIEISADFQYDANATATNNGPLVGLYNSQGTHLTANSYGAAGPLDIVGDTGFKAGKLIDLTAGDVKLYGETISGTNPNLSVFGDTVLGTSSSGVDGDDLEVHNLKLRIELAANLSDLLLTASYDAFTGSTATVSGASLTFDEAVIKFNGAQAGKAGSADNVLVTTNVPEPAMVGLVLAGLGLMTLGRKRSV